MKNALGVRRPPPSVWYASAIVLVGVGIAATIYATSHAPTARGGPATEPGPSGAPTASESVTLTAEKLEAAGIESEAAERAALPVEVAVAGLIEPNPDRFVQIRPRVVGIVRSVAVQPSEVVPAGTVLATLESAEVGTARLELRSRQLDLEIVRTEAEWKSEVAGNIEALAAALDKKTPASTLEKTFAGCPIGTHRAELLSAYADLEIASHEEVRQEDLFRRKIVGEHPMMLAVHGRESAQAKFEAELEQNRYDAAQEKRLADQRVRRAEAAVIDAAKRLEILGVTAEAADRVPVAGDPASASGVEDVAAYPLHAPFEGTILERSAVISQRAEPTDVLFTLGDLRTVRIVANVPESTLGLLPGLEGRPVAFTAAAYPGRTFEAKVLYTGAAVDPATRTVRLVAEAPNAEGFLRPSMFVRIALAGREAEPAVTVPAGALVEVDGRPGVFRPEAGGRTFTFRPVEPGRESAGRRAILSGLEPGDRVVAAGAFLLKSELVLQNEPEED